MVRSALPIARENAATFVALASLESLAGGSILSVAESMRCDRFRQFERRQAFAAGRTLLRMIIGKVRGVEARAINFAVVEHGQLLMVDTAGGANLSHSGQWVGAAYAPTGAVGIDVQLKKPVKRWQPLAQRLFSGPVACWIAGQADPQSAFLNVFSAAESLGKAQGTGWAGGAGCKITVTREGHIGVRPSLCLGLELTPVPAPDGYIAWVCHPPGLPVKQISS